nr:hypothetical protein [uncultured Methanoregula sp.]
MKPVSWNTFSARLVLAMIGLSLLASFAAGIDTVEDATPDENAGNVHQLGIGALFFNKCLHICSFYYSICLTNNPYKSPPRDLFCRKDLVACNSTCVESHTVPP